MASYMEGGGLLEAVMGLDSITSISSRVLSRQKGTAKFCFYCWFQLFFVFTLNFIVLLIRIHDFQKRNVMNLTMVIMESNKQIVPKVFPYLSHGPS